MVKLRKSVILTAILLPLVSALAAGTIGAQAGSSPPAPNSPRGLAFSSPRGSSGILTPSKINTAAIACDGAFDLVASPNGTGHNDIFATSAISANDVWAVGAQTNASGFDRTLAEHWNGSAWSIVPTPNPGSTHNDLNGVVAISSNDVWAVGDYEINATTGYVNTFAAHWNGSSWTLVTSTQNPMFYNWLFAVDAVSSTDVWAVGTSWSAGYFTLVEHWDGSTWSVVSSPNQLYLGSSTDNLLFSVSAFSSTDVWAVGYFGISTFQSLAEHWNGGSWSVVATPNLSGDNQIASVKALEAGHAVGVGYGNFTNGGTPAQAEAWDLLSPGVSTSTGLAAVGSGDNILEGVARSGSSVWAVGFWRATTSSVRQTLAWSATWDSTSHTLTWGSVGTSASPATTNNVLFAVAAVSPSAFWAVGYMNSGGFDQSLMESYCALHFGIGAPTSTFLGQPFSITVTAKNSSGTTATGYQGTVHFTSSDQSAVLPGDYTFTSPDAGAHTFTGVVLNKQYGQTITVSDTVTTFITGSAVISVTCRGACSGPSGTPGSRDDTQSTGGTPSSRSANPSTGAAPPGPSGSRLAQSRSGAKGSSGPVQTTVSDATTPQTTNMSVPSLAAPGHGQAIFVGFEPDPGKVGGSDPLQGATPESVWGYPPGLGAALALAVLMLLARRRNNRRLHAKSRP